MKLSLHVLVCLLIVSLLGIGEAQAKKYKPVNEIPKEVPATDEEKRIWQVGIAHQKQVRGTDELVNNEALEQYLESIVARLMGPMVDQIGLQVDVLVFKDPTVNAWVYPNGTVAVQTGMLAAMKNEAQLAAILGHEVSHFLNRHAFIQIKAKQKQSIIGKGLGVLATAAVAAKTGQIATGLLDSGQIWTDLVTSGYSRKLETKADAQGLQLMIEAGYPPKEALPGFETMRQKEDDQVNVAKMWSSHPDIDARKKNLAKQIKKAKVADNQRGLDEEFYLRSVALGVLSNTQLLLEQRKFDSAISSLDRYTSIINDDATGYYLLGEAQRRKNADSSLEQRIAAYQKAIKINPDFADPYRELGMAYRQQGNAQEALDAFTQYLRRATSADDAPIIAWFRTQLMAKSAGSE